MRESWGGSREGRESWKKGSEIRGRKGGCVEERRDGKGVGRRKEGKERRERLRTVVERRQV